MAVVVLSFGDLATAMGSAEKDVDVKIAAGLPLGITEEKMVRELGGNTIDKVEISKEGKYKAFFFNTSIRHSVRVSVLVDVAKNQVVWIRTDKGDRTAPGYEGVEREFNL